MYLNQVTLPATDLARSVEFYSRLGLVQIVDALPRYARFECPDGFATLSLHQADSVDSESGVTIYLECSPLDQVVAEIERRGLRFESGPVDQRWLWREAHIRDPDGNRICLYEAGENRRFPPWRVASRGRLPPRRTAHTSGAPRATTTVFRPTGRTGRGSSSSSTSSFSDEPLFYNYFDRARVTEILTSAGLELISTAIHEYPESDGSTTTDVFLKFRSTLPQGERDVPTPDSRR